MANDDEVILNVTTQGDSQPSQVLPAAKPSLEHLVLADDENNTEQGGPILNLPRQLPGQPLKDYYSESLVSNSIKFSYSDYRPKRMCNA